VRDLESRSAPLEYWFLKFHAGDLAFLVDFIIRRATGRAEVRVSLWVRGEGRVARAVTSEWKAAGPDVATDAGTFGAGHSAGAVDDVSWELRYDAGMARAAPGVPPVDRAFDMSLVSRPRSVFDGSVTVAGERFEVRGARGSLTHYWGRRLPDRWHWISATSFGDDDVTVEAVLLRTRLWGARPGMTVGYFWMADGDRTRMVVSPLSGLVTVSGQPTDYTLTARGPRGTTRLRCSAPAQRYNDLGEGIRQTLLGRCEILGRGLVDPSAGLEYRRSG
jgi:hypothetical protein